MPAEIAVGVAGWSYPDWEGIVYPRGTADKLAHVARYVDAIEINSTFYRIPSPAMAASWAERTRDLEGFFFTAKLHQDITHRGTIERAAVDAHREGLRPLIEAGRLRHLLAQFPGSVRDTPASRERLLRIRDAFSGLAGLVLELRHNSWQSPGALAFLESLGVTVANLDYPLSRDAFTMRECRIGEDAYFRLHGRNRKAWFDRNAGRDETYNYDYSRAELYEILDRVRAVAATARRLTLIANNHYRGKELANALELKWLLTGLAVRVPAGLADAYPRLAEVAAPRVPEGKPGT